MRSQFLRGVLLLGAFLLSALPARADEMTAEQRKAVQKGLDYLAKTQHKDGHWEAFGGQYPVTMTGISGMALLMEGSTIREGKYAKNIRQAVDWLMGRNMYGHGFATLFLASVYGEEEDGERRKKLEDILTRAVLFIGKAQTTRGG